MGMLKRLCILFHLCCLFSSCTSGGDGSTRAETLKQWMMQNGKIKAFSTIAMVNDLVKQVGGQYVDTTVLIQEDLDPHSYQLVKGDDEKLAFADLIFYNGLGLEHGASLHSYLQRHVSKTVPLGDRLMKDHPELIYYHQGQLDPHIWMDVALWVKTVPYIVESLSHKDPSHANEYHRNGDELVRNLLIVDEEIRRELQQVPAEKRYLVTSHDAFNYFTHAYLADKNEDESEWRHRFFAPEGLAPESQISTTDIQNTIDHLDRYRIHVIFPESNVNKDSIRKIVSSAQEKGLDVRIVDAYLYADAMGKSGSDGDTYEKMMRHNAKQIASHLQK